MRGSKDLVLISSLEVVADLDLICGFLGELIGIALVNLRGRYEDSRRENYNREKIFRGGEHNRGENLGKFWGKRGLIRGDNNRSNVKWEDSTSLRKGEEIKKTWGGIGTNTEVLRTKDRGTCFRCLQSGYYQARCTNPPVCYKCKKTCHMPASCPEDRKNQGLKLYGFGIPGEGFTVCKY